MVYTTSHAHSRFRGEMTKDLALAGHRAGIDALAERRAAIVEQLLVLEEQLAAVDGLIAGAERTDVVVDGTPLRVRDENTYVNVFAVETNNRRRAKPYTNVRTGRWHVELAGDQQVCGLTYIVTPHPQDPGLSKDDAVDLAMRWVADGLPAMAEDELPISAWR